MSKFVKRMLGWIVDFIFHTTLFVSISMAGILPVVQSPNLIKSTLRESKIYEKFVDEVIRESAKTPGKGSFSLEDPAVKKIINNAFPAKLLQDSNEKVIDATHAWLSGETDKLTFLIDFTVQKQQIAKNLSTYAYDRLAFLPICNQPPENYDPFTSPCRPDDNELDAQQLQLEQELLTTTSFLPDTTLTEENLPRDVSGRPIIDHYSYAPKLYKIVLLAPYFLGFLCLLSIAAHVALQDRKRRSWRNTSLAVMNDAIFVGGSTVLFGKIIPYFTPALSVRIESSGVQGLLDKPLQELSNVAENTIINICIVLICIGFASWLLERVSRGPLNYSHIEKSSGLVSSVSKVTGTRNPRTISAKDAPIQSSEGPRKKKRKPNNSKKRNIKA